MPRIYKGSENTLKLLVHTCDPDTIDNLKIVLFTDDPNSAAEFYSDSITIEGNIASLKVNAWSFDNMNEGVINYIASGELGNDTFLTERQSNYYLKSPNNYTPTTPDFDNYYTKPEIDEMLEDIEVDVDLTGYATEQWVRQQGYVTDSDVNDYVGNEIGQLEEIINTKQDKLVSGTNIKTINGNDILGEGDITIEGGGSGSGALVIDYTDRDLGEEDWNMIQEAWAEGTNIYLKNAEGTRQVMSVDGFYFTTLRQSGSKTYIGNGGYTVFGGYSFSEQKLTEKGYPYGIIDINSEFGINSFLLSVYLKTDLPNFIKYNDGLTPVFYDKGANKIETIIEGKLYTWDLNGANTIYPTITELGGGSGSSEDAGTYILESVEDIYDAEWWYNPSDGTNEYIQEYTQISYNNDSERVANNLDVINAILEDKCKTLYYKRLSYNQEILIETDADGREHRKYQPIYTYGPSSWCNIDFDLDDEESLIFSAFFKEGMHRVPFVFTFKLNKNTAEKEWLESYTYLPVGDFSNEFWFTLGNTLSRGEALMVTNENKPCYININTNEGTYRGKYLLQGFENYSNNTYEAYCIDKDGLFYKWVFAEGVEETTPTITNLKTEPVDLTPYYTKEEVDQLLADLDLTDYYTKAETDELIANINLGDSSTISSIVSTEVSNQLTDNFKTINGETIIGEGDIVIEAGTDVDLNNYYTKEETDTAISEGKRIGILECVEQLINFENGAWIQYGEDDRQSHNATVIQNALDGAYDIVVYKHLFERANEQNIFIYIPLAFRYPSHDGYFRATGLLETNEYAGSSSAKLIHMMMNNDGSVNSFGVDDVNLLSSGSGGNNSELGVVTIESFTARSECYFNNGEAPVDNASGIATAFKVGRIATNKLWVNELHMPNGGTEVGKINFTTTKYNVPENTTDSEKIVASIDAEGNIYEGTTKLTDKYATKGYIKPTDVDVNYGYEDSAIVALATNYLSKVIVEKAYNEHKALFVYLGSEVKKQIPVSIETKYNSDAEITGYEVWGWYSKTQTITWVFDEDTTDVAGTIE